jgi:hypothetical protein
MSLVCNPKPPAVPRGRWRAETTNRPIGFWICMEAQPQ